MLRDALAGEVFILIDALDECERSTRNPLLVGLRELIRSPLVSREKLKFIITYRPDVPDIEYELSHSDDVQTNLRMDSSEANADLSDYINVEVDELAQRRHHSKGLKDDVKQALAGRAGGTFL